MNLEKNWQLKIDTGVYKDLSKFPKGYSDKILKAILSLGNNPYSGDIEKIKGEEIFGEEELVPIGYFMKFTQNSILCMFFG